MLAFLRRHQKIFFVVITVVIVISFSFFGTYSTIVEKPTRDEVAFVAIDGSKVYQSELQDLTRFISFDSADERSVAQPYSGNGLNDGVIAKDILETGLGLVVAKPFLQQLAPGLITKMQREKSYTPYRHPHAPFISAELVWNYFAPDVKIHFDALISNPQEVSESAFQNRIQLYLAERRFPSYYLKQLIRYQESQHESIGKDEQLLGRDLSLFGYHNAQDWFGKEYVELVAQYIINAAKYAESQGWAVSTDEALGSLFMNAKQTFNDGKFNQYYGISSPNEYFQTTVHRLGMDQGRAAYAWRWVLLFRRFMNEEKDAVLVDNLAFRDFYNNRNEFVDVALYTLPKELQLKTALDVEKFDLYLKAVIHPKALKADKIFYPFEAKMQPQEVKKLYPDLVKRKLRLRYSSCNIQELEGRIGLKKTWQWQVEDSNWKRLQEKFPELAKTSQAKDRDDRQKILDALDAQIRLKVDAFSRRAIVDQNPAWIHEALEKAEVSEEEVSLREKGGSFPFSGIQDRRALFVLLDQAPLHQISESLQSYSQDGVHYYRIAVLERGEEELLTYEEALADGTLDQMLNTALEMTYQRVRKENPSRYLTDDGDWKPLASVKPEIASVYFEESFSSLDREVEKMKKEIPHLTSWDDREQARIACRLAPYMKEAFQAVKDNPDAASEWKLICKEKKIVRNESSADVDSREAFSLQKHTWSKLRFSRSSGLVFYKVLEKGIVDSEEEVRAKAFAARRLLAQKLEIELGEKLLTMMQDKKALAVMKEPSAKEQQ